MKHIPFCVFMGQKRQVSGQNRMILKTRALRVEKCQYFESDTTYLGDCSSCLNHVNLYMVTD